MAELTEVQKQMRINEEKVFSLIKENNGRLKLDDLERLSGVPWRGGDLSDALYGLDQIQGRITRSSRDLFSCTFWVVEG